MRSILQRQPRVSATSRTANTHPATDGPGFPEHNGLKSAVAYVARHMAERIRLADLAATAGVSNRTLEYLFLRHFGTTPMAFVKRQRLEAARRLLAAADPRESTVAAVARQCGFTHMGQFALDYKRGMGERPSTTLKRPA